MDELTRHLKILADFYRRETGKEPVESRLLKLSRYLSANSLTVSEVRLAVNWDRAWASRSNRSELERHATLIGSTAKKTGGQEPSEYFWVVPLDLPRVRKKLLADGAAGKKKKGAG